MEVALSQQMMDCPECGWRINKALVCSGRTNPVHKGLPFRSCSKCPYFEMLMEEQAAAVGVTFPDQDLVAQPRHGPQVAQPVRSLQLGFPPVQMQLLLPEPNANLGVSLKMYTPWVTDDGWSL